jgi:antitoxin component YwqK of YwqJK toxin-antitoxin module
MKYYIVIYCVFLLASCTININNVEQGAAQTTIPPLRIENTDNLLHFDKGVYYYGQESFSGIIIERYANGNIKRSGNYLSGKEEGWQTMYYNSGAISEKRYYRLGEKDSVHTGWWDNGHLRFEYHFSHGAYEGDFKEWYTTGQPYKHIHYVKGTDDQGIGWRENGKLYMNYIMRDGRRYGVVNPNLCYTVKDEQGEYANASTARAK